MTPSWKFSAYATGSQSVYCLSLAFICHSNSPSG